MSASITAPSAALVSSYFITYLCTSKNFKEGESKTIKFIVPWKSFKKGRGGEGREENVELEG